MSKKGIYFLVFAILMSSLAIALEQVAESSGSFDVDAGDAIIFRGNVSGNEFCGNDIKEGSEQCDGSDLSGATCSSLISNGQGSLSCQSTCIYDTSACTSNPPTNGGGGPSGGSSSSSSSFEGTTRRESCIESWQCTDWSPCINGKQTRSCIDSASCGTQSLKPATERTCEEDKELKINGEGSAFNRITGAAIGALRNLRNYEVVGIILFILAIVGSALIINSIRKPEESASQGMEEKEKVEEKPKNSKKAEK